MSLRSKILQHALPRLPTHSFTRHNLSLALTSLPPSHPDYRPDPTPEGMIDTLFGEGLLAPGQALTEAWEKEGRDGMQRADVQEGVSGILRGRLRWSAAVGENLVQVCPGIPSHPTSDF